MWDYPSWITRLVWYWSLFSPICERCRYNAYNACKRQGRCYWIFNNQRTHNPESADIHCMGILPQYHSKGIGKLLIKELENYLKNEGVKILQVKTVSADRECRAYAKTRAFYKAVGFFPLEVFPNLWNEANPNLILVKQIWIIPYEETMFYIKSGRSVMMPSTLSAFSSSIIGRSFTPRLLAPQTKSGNPIFSAADLSRE